MSSLEEAIRKHIKFNLLVNLLDGGVFGLAWGFGSMGTILPLFVSRMTDSAILIGMIPAIHGVAWQFPQLFMANRVSRLRRYKPIAMFFTLHERVPYLGLALVAFFLVKLGPVLGLSLTFLLLLWQGLGSGLTANPWQSLIAKIIPPDWRGTFFGLQAALANVAMSLTAIAAGFILDRLPNRLDFAACFMLAAIGLGISMVCLGLTREPEDTEKVIPAHHPLPWRQWLEILRQDRNFSAFLFVRFLSSFATMGFAFYIVYGLRQFAMNEVTAGFLTATLFITQTVANAVMGWVGDRRGHRWMLIAGALAMISSSLLAWGAPSINWMYPAFILSGLANVGYWTIGMAFTMGFGTEETRPTYIGLSNTLVAPVTILAPILGGWIAESAGFKTTFMVSALSGVVIAILLVWLVRDPGERR